MNYKFKRADVNDKRLVITDWIGEGCNIPEEIKLRTSITSTKKGEVIDIIVSNMLLKTHGRVLDTSS